MEMADVAGLIGSALLLFAPARDQLYRWRIRAIERRGRRPDALNELRQRLANLEERKRNQPTVADSFTFALGAVGLGLSYVI